MSMTTIFAYVRESRERAEHAEAELSHINQLWIAEGTKCAAALDLIRGVAKACDDPLFKAKARAFLAALPSEGEQR